MYRHQDHGAGADQHFQLTPSSGSSPFTQSQFASPIYGIDPSLQSSPHHLHPSARSAPGRQSSHLRQSSMEAPGSMQPPRSSVSPRLGIVTPAPGGGSGFIPTDRSPPAKNVTADTIANAFEQFILYCNPNFPLDVDTTALKTAFQTPPKSDNKDFETFTLFQLIQKFEAKEIKTWGQLALDLGVEAPDTAKGQSVQKVQQYSVRLKRWMRAMHIDAFFDFLNGKQHNYFTEIPHPSDPYPSTGRDGVMAEEDLAIRALDPSFRPKRGRRRNSETQEDDSEEPSSKQARLLDSAAPMSAMPFSAHPDNFNDPWAVASAVTPHNFAPWGGRPGGPTSAAASGNLRWQVAHAQTPSTPHPASAMSTSMSAHIDAAFDGEPRSAITPRRRRKHGPAVSSAWPISGAPGAKPRGRPPANRNIQDGPFGTFPVDPSNDKAKASGVLPTPISTTIENKPALEDPSPRTTTPSSYTPGEGRGHRLSLQVPVHTGGPVRLATPPTLLVNGETNETSSKSDSDDPTRTAVSAPPQIPPQAESSTNPTITTTTTQTTKRSAGFSFETLKRVVASDLLRSEIIGRRHRLTGEEAKRLADSVLDRLNVPNTSSVRDDLARLTAASWLGVGNQFNVPLGPSAGLSKRINVTRFRTDADGYEEITFDEGDVEDVREVYDIFWHVSQGGCTGAFEMKGLTSGKLTDAQSMHDTILKRTTEAVTNLQKEGWLEKSIQDVYTATARTNRVMQQQQQDDGVDWKARYQALEFAGMLAKGEVERVQQRMLEKVMDALL